MTAPTAGEVDVSMHGVEPTSAQAQEATSDGPNKPATDGPGDERRTSWSRVIGFGLLPGIALVIAAGSGYLRWIESSARDAEQAREQSVIAASDGAVAMLSYHSETVEKDLDAARDRLAGSFRDTYSSLTHDVVIPGARERAISSVATIPAAACMSATANDATVLVFVNQAITVGSGPPTSSTTAVKIDVRKSGERWLITDFTPI